MTDILLYAAELAASESAKPIHHRAEQHAHLELHEFVAFFRDSWTFVVKCEVICRKMIVGLRGVAVGQVCVLSSFRAVDCFSFQFVKFKRSLNASVLLLLETISLILDSSIQMATNAKWQFRCSAGRDLTQLCWVTLRLHHPRRHFLLDYSRHLTSCTPHMRMHGSLCLPSFDSLEHHKLLAHRCLRAM